MVQQVSREVLRIEAGSCIPPCTGWRRPAGEVAWAPSMRRGAWFVADDREGAPPLLKRKTLDPSDERGRPGAEAGVTMSWLGRVRNRWRERKLAREFDAELRFHLDSRIDANIRRGMAPDEAAREARWATQRGCARRCARRGSRPGSTGWAGTSAGVRVFARHPLLTALAIVTLSLGIGANAAIYSLFEAVLLRPLPCPGGRPAGGANGRLARRA